MITNIYVIFLIFYFLYLKIVLFFSYNQYKTALYSIEEAEIKHITNEKVKTILKFIMWNLRYWGLTSWETLDSWRCLREKSFNVYHRAQIKSPRLIFYIVRLQLSIMNIFWFQRQCKRSYDNLLNQLKYLKPQKIYSIMVSLFRCGCKF